MSVSSGRFDMLPHELFTAGAVALAMLLGSGGALSVADLGKRADVPEIDKTQSVPIRVRPVLDMDSPKLLKLGGNQRVKLPDEWVKPDAPVVERKAQVSTQADQTASAIPPRDLDVADAGAPIAPDADVVASAEVEVDAGDVPQGAGGGDPAGDPRGTETDPLKARAVSQYHSRILGFLYGGWSCPSGAKTGCSARAVMSLSGLTVAGTSFTPCGDSVLDSAAQSHAQGKVGQSIPPPPENYPDLAPPSFTVTYVCK